MIGKRRMGKRKDQRRYTGRRENKKNKTRQEGLGKSGKKEEKNYKRQEDSVT